MLHNKTQYLSERMTRIDSSRIRRAFDLAAKLENPINLSIGQPHYPTPQPIRDAISQAVQDGKTAYTPTQGILPLREKLAEKYHTKNNFQVHPDSILISSGVSSLLQLLFLSVVDPGDRILLTDPYFLIYKSMLSFFNAKIETIPEDFTERDIENINPVGLKMILFSSPSNPTGYIMQPEQIKMLGNLADQSGAWLVSDEIYELFDYDKKFTSAAAIYPDAVTLTGFSKTYSMTGLRLAAATGPAKLIQSMSTLQQYTVVCAPSPVQWAGITALDLDMTSYVEEYHNNRDKICKALEGKYKFRKPGGAFYLFPEINGKDDDFVERAIDKSLLIVPGSIFTSKTNTIRISFGVDQETLERGISVLIDLA